MASPVDNIRKGGGGGGRRIGETGSVIHRLLRRFPSARHKFGKQVFYPPSLPFLLRGIEFSTVPSVPTSTPKDTSAPFAQHYKTALEGGNRGFVDAIYYTSHPNCSAETAASLRASSSSLLLLLLLLLPFLSSSFFFRFFFLFRCARMSGLFCFLRRDKNSYNPPWGFI